MIKYKLNQPFIYVFIGFNDPKVHKRGVENIISLQSSALTGQKKFYIFFGPQTKVSRWDDMIVISIKKFDFVGLNLTLNFLKKKYQAKLFVHSHNYQVSFGCLYAINVFTVHDGLTYLYKRFGRKYILLFRLIELTIYRRALKVHFISNFAKSEALYKKKHDSKSVIIYNSTPLESLVPDPTFNVNEPQNESFAIKIFCVRSIEKRARIDLVIEACIKLKEYQVPITISVAGKGPLLNSYLNTIKNRKVDNLSLLGYVDDIALINYYATCDLVVMPSEYGEGFGLPIIEGYLFGKPVIASNRCAIPEIIIEKEMMFENNADAVVEKILYVIAKREILHDPAKYSAYYANNFSHKQITELYRNKLYKL